MKNFSVNSYVSSLSPSARRRVYWAAGLLFFYTLIGFVILPVIARSIAVKRLTRELNREVTIRSVRMNPYVLSASIRGLLIKDKDGEPLVKWEEVYANFQLSSLVTKPWVFKEVRVVQPYARVQVNKDRTLNFSDLLKKFSETAEKPAKPSKPLALRVDWLHIVGAEASYTDLTPSAPFHRRMGPVQMTLTGFHTDPENKNPYSFSGTTDSGEKFSWSGHFFLDPLRSHGEFAVENVSLPQYAPVYQDFVKFEIRDGIVDLRAAYDLMWSASTNVAVVTNTSVRLRSFKLAEKGSTNSVAEVANISVTGVSADTAARRGQVNLIAVRGGRLIARRTADARVNLIDLAQPGGTNISGSVLLMLQSVTNLFAQLLSSTNAASGVVREVDIRDCQLRFEDLANPRPVQLELTDVSFAATNLSNLPGSNFTASASLRWNTNGAIRADLSAALAPPSADVEFNLDQLELSPFGPYLDQFVSVFIVGSRLNMDGRVWLRATNNIGPTAAFGGNLRLEGFSSIDGETGEDLVKFDLANFSGINAQLNPPEFSVKELALNNLSAQVVLETNGMLNVVRVIRLAGTNVPAPSGKEEKAPATAASTQPSSKSFGDLRRQFGSLMRLYSATNLAGVQVPVKASVDAVVLSNAAVLVSDRSVSPHVRTSLRNVNGEITGVSSEMRHEIALKLHAQVDQTGPVEITASLPPAGPAVTNRLKVILKNVDLNPAGPYSGKFLGYTLRKGKLNVEMNYQMTDRKIKAQNVVVLDQFTLGEKVPSPEATKLPVKLAVAILKDRNGRIELDVPIEGDLDDPKFRLGKVITHTIVNVITKIVTSPFAALGKLFGGKGEEVRFQDFDAGSTELSAASMEKLNAVINALYERPGLELEVEGSVDPRTDRAALCHEKMEKEFRAKKWAALRKSEQERISPGRIPFTPEEFGHFVQQLHAAKFPPDEAQPSRTAATSQPGPPVSTRGKKGAETLVKAEEVPVPADVQVTLERDLFPDMDITDDDYRTLAAARAFRVKQHIAQSGKIEQERLFLADLSNQNVSTNGSRVYLHFK